MKKIFNIKLTKILTLIFSILFSIPPVDAQTWKNFSKNSNLPIVIENSSCNPNIDTAGIKIDRSAILTCQSGIWKNGTGSNSPFLPFSGKETITCYFQTPQGLTYNGVYYYAQKQEFVQAKVLADGTPQMRSANLISIAFGYIFESWNPWISTTFSEVFSHSPGDYQRTVISTFYFTTTGIFKDYYGTLTLCAHLPYP